jgi:hypothetical protein
MRYLVGGGLDYEPFLTRITKCRHFSVKVAYIFVCACNVILKYNVTHIWVMDLHWHFLFLYVIDLQQILAVRSPIPNHSKTAS